MLDSAEQVLFARLAVFAGGFTLEAADAVCNAFSDLEMSTLQGIALLLEEEPPQAIRRRAPPMRATRCWKLFANMPGGEWLKRVKEAGWGQPGSSDCMQSISWRWRKRLRLQSAGAEQIAWSEHLKGDYNNLRAALQYALGEGNAQLALELSASIGIYWEINYYFAEGLQWLEQALALPQFGERQECKESCLWHPKPQSANRICGEFLERSRPRERKRCGPQDACIPSAPKTPQLIVSLKRIVSLEAES